MSLFIKKNNKYYRNNSDGTLTEVLLGEDGYFRWKQSDGKSVRSALRYKIVTKPKEKSLILKFGDWLVDTSIQASVADNPSVMTAAGYEKDGSWKVNPTSKGATKLREDLPVLGTVGLAVTTPGAITSMLIGSGTETVERKAFDKSLGDITSGLIKEVNPIPNEGYLGTLGNYLWDKGADLVRPEYIAPTVVPKVYKWGTTPRHIGDGAEFDVETAPFWNYVIKTGDSTPEYIALRNLVPGSIPMKYKGQTPEGLYQYTQRKAYIPKKYPSSKLMNKLYSYLRDKGWVPDKHDGYIDFIKPTQVNPLAVLDIGDGNVAYRNLFDYVFKRRPVMIDNSVLNMHDYFAMYLKKGGKLIPKAKSGIKIKKENKGKFTEYCGGKVTNECILKAKNSGNPKLIKRATFAANARKWKHKKGGILKCEGGNILNLDLRRSVGWNSPLMDTVHVPELFNYPKINYMSVKHPKMELLNANKSYEDLRRDYVNFIENRYKVGWDETTLRWYRPTLKGYDNRLIAYGLDTVNNKQVRDYLAKVKRDWLTDEEATQLQLLYFDYLEEVFNRQTAKLRMSNISDKKHAMAIGVLYRGDGPKLWKSSNGLGKTFINGSDEDFLSAISNYYRNISLKTRANDHNEYWTNNL